MLKISDIRSCVQLRIRKPILFTLVSDWIGLSSVLRPRQHSIGYMGDGFYRSQDPTNSIKVLKEMLQRTNQTTKTTKYTYAQTIIETKKDIHKISTTSPLVYTRPGVIRLPKSADSPGLNGGGTAAAVPPHLWIGLCSV